MTLCLYARTSSIWLTGLWCVGLNDDVLLILDLQVVALIHFVVPRPWSHLTQVLPCIDSGIPDDRAPQT